MKTETLKHKTQEEVLIEGEHNYATLTDKISDIVLEQKPPRQWFIVFGFAFFGLTCLMVAAGWLFIIGVGIWGVNIPVGWGFAIINFVWWIGIGHAGTLISAILLLMRQRWRNSINRLAETMTLFAVMCAGMFPILHLGRPWIFYWLIPYPNALGVWPQFRSPLVWDVFAVTTYLTVSLLFWYVGLIPDLATLRDKAKSKLGQVLSGIFALGWRGAASHWHRYESAYLLLAGLSTPLVVSVHSVVSLDFAVSIIPGWHTTIFPPYFVAGAIYSGFAMVLTLVIPIRKWWHLEDLVTMRHLEWMARIMLATGLIVFYGYLVEAFYGFYSGNPYEWFMIKNRALGPYSNIYWALILCNGIMPQFLWIKSVRNSIAWLFFLSLVVNTGMWLERFVIVITSLHRDYMPSSWGMYTPTIWDWLTWIGTFGFFLTGMVLFVRFLPTIPIAEIKHLFHSMKHEKPKEVEVKV
ncbi:MAG TPA: NrfD/PsrC family molybdoenzyme membrane anchor subunit [Fimbriimonadales bacterium]|nr:NrfD/PsrC family molybdoenzyme membrane anchor subunit [Fimbriimonadales bacterium]